MSLYLSAQILLVILTFTILVFIILAFRHAFAKMQYSDIKKRKLLYFISFGLTCWLGILTVLSFLGVFTDFESFPPKILLAVTPAIILIIALMLSRSFFKVLRWIPPAWLIYIQSFRILLEIILWMGLVAGFIPFQITFEGFNYDIIAGITALMGGFVFFARGRLRRMEASLWNVFGIILIINIITISVLSTPSPFRVFMNEPANTFVAYFPFIWIPGFLVPFALAMHLFSLKQLWYYKKLN